MVNEQLDKYLKWAKNHYKSLAKLMENSNKEQYKIEHLGKVKFIDLLLLKNIEGEFDDEIYYSTNKNLGYIL